MAKLSTYWYGWLFLVAIMIVLTPWFGDIDLAVSRHFFSNGHFRSSSFLDFIYYYAIFPGWLLVAVGALLLFFSSWPKAGIYILLTLLIGSGIISHLLLKDHWGRPRPKQIIEFGGNQSFRNYYNPHFSNSETSKSFPCGHCTMGFYFFSLIFLGITYQKRWLYSLGLVLTVGLGGLLSYARLAQGGHYLSDVIVSCLIMWLTALLLYPILRSNKDFKKVHIS